MKRIISIMMISLFVFSASATPGYCGFNIGKFAKKTIKRVTKEVERGAKKLGNEVKILDTVGQAVVDIYKGGVETFERVILRKHVTNVINIKKEVRSIKNQTEVNLVDVEELRQQIRNAQTSDEVDSVLYGIARVLARTMNFSNSAGSLGHFYNTESKDHFYISNYMLQMNLFEIELMNQQLLSCLRSLPVSQWGGAVSKTEALDSVEECVYEEMRDTMLWDVQKLTQVTNDIHKDHELSGLYQTYQSEVDKVRGLKQKIVRNLDGLVVGLQNLRDEAESVEQEADRLEKSINNAL